MLFPASSSRTLPYFPPLLFSGRIRHAASPKDARRAETLSIRSARALPPLSEGRAATEPPRETLHRRATVRRRDRIRRIRDAADRQRDPVAAQLHPARSARTGEVAHPALAR